MFSILNRSEATVLLAGWIIASVVGFALWALSLRFVATPLVPKVQEIFGGSWLLESGLVVGFESAVTSVLLLASFATVGAVWWQLQYMVE